MEALFAEVLAAGERPAALREALERRGPDDLTLLALLRRAVPVRLLDLLASTPPWSRSPRVLAGIVLNPRTPPARARELLPALFWRDLAEVAAAPRLTVALRAQAEAQLAELLPDLRVGDRIALARLATPALLQPLLVDEDRRVVAAALANPRLREEDLLRPLRDPAVPGRTIEEIAASRRGQASYAVRLAVFGHPRTPLAVALAQLTSLRGHDLHRLAAEPTLRPLLQAAAARVSANRSPTD